MDRPEIILAPGPTPIPPEVLLAQGSPLVYHRGPGFGNLMRDVTGRLKQLYRTDDGRRAADDLLGHRRPRVRDPEPLLARRRGLRAARGVLLGAVQDARRGLRAHGAHDRVRVGHEDPPRRRGRRARRAPREGRAAHAVRDLDRGDPADRGSSRAWRTTPARSSWSTSCRRSAPCRSRSTRGASTSRSGARRRRSRRAPASRSSRSATGRGRPARRRRTRASTSTGARTSRSPTCRTPRTRGRPRSA